MWMSIIKLQFQILARKCDISNWLFCGADGRTVRGTYGQVTTKIFRMHRITKILLPMVVVVKNTFRGILLRLTK